MSGDEWVSWFGDDGRARHYHVDSPRGAEIAAALASASASRTCGAPGCERLLHGRGDKRYCSDACRKRAARPRYRVVGHDLPGTPITRTSDIDLPGATRAVIADTADANGRRCAECGRDIGDRRDGARFCGDSCRKRLARRARAIAHRAELSDLLGVPDEAPR